MAKGMQKVFLFFNLKKKKTRVTNGRHLLLSCYCYEKGKVNLPSFFSIGVVVKKAMTTNYCLFIFSLIYPWVFYYEKGFSFLFFA
jgi:hypothetical protein